MIGENVALDRLVVFSGNANPRLAKDIVGHLHLELGIRRLCADCADTLTGQHHAGAEQRRERVLH